MRRPAQTPIGLHLTRTTRLVTRAFDEALAGAGGSLPVWLVLLNLKITAVGSQRELADAVGVTGPTLTHHLNAMEADGLLVRRRDPANRRNHMIELTSAGEERFAELRDAAVAFDARLRAGFTPEEIDVLAARLDRLTENVSGSPPGPAWAGLIDGASAERRET